MTEGPRLVPRRRSVFVRLTAIMMGMALSIMGLVAGFFTYVVNPQVDEALDRVLTAYASTVAADAPDLDAARAISARAGLIVSYDGPRGSWSTASGSAGPSLGAGAAQWGETRLVLDSPDGGRYGFSWKIGIPIRAAHDKLLLMVLALIVGVLILGHEVLRYSLRSVRLLYAGVERIGRGDLEVEVPRRSRDELGALTDAFNEMAKRVREMITLRDQLLLDVSHELRSPLTRMKVALALLPEGEKRARLETDVGEMEGMIGSILELERLRDVRGLTLADRDLVPLIRETTIPFADVPPGVQLDLPSRRVDMAIDADRFRMLMRNLLDNAVKYSLPDSRPIHVSLSEEPRLIRILVSDNGPGIAPGDLRNVFEPFFRSDPSRSKKTGGVGLGLSICERIVEAHGGAIRAENHEDRGTRIVVELPRLRS